MWKFEVYQNMREIKDSMQLDSGTDICKLTTDAGVVEICVQGFVCVDWSPSVFNDESNWFEIVLNKDEAYDVVDIEGSTEEELLSLCLEMLDVE